MRERIEFDDMPPRAEREIWCEWLRQHGVNPNHVKVPGWIERRPDRCQLAYEGYERDRETGEIVARDGQVHPVRVMFQMEAPPLPFPLGRHYALG